MRILGLDTGIDHDLIDDVPFGSMTSALDYDIIIWDLSEILYRYEKYRETTYKGVTRLSTNGTVCLENDTNRRQKEFNELLKLGRTIIVMTPTPENYYIDTGKTEISGKTLQSVRLLDLKDVLSTIPVKGLKTIAASGSSIEFRGGEPFDKFWSANKDRLVYNAYFETNIGKPLFFIRGTNKVVGSHLSLENGHVLFLPHFSLPEDNWEENQREYLLSIISLVEAINAKDGDFNLPIWSSNYILPQESQERTTLKALEKQLDDLLSRMDEQRKVILGIETNKALFTGTGRALEVKVGEILTKLGFQVSEGIPGRDDLILEHNGQIAVVEVKGVGKSAAEKHAAQLEKWVAEYYAAKGAMPKGILIVNTFKDLPLTERIEEHFPHQMRGYSERRGHCLLTSTQLLCMYLDYIANPDKQDFLISKLLTHIGELDDYKDWSRYIVVTPPEQESSA